MSVVNGVTVVMPPPEGYVVDFENPQRQYVQQYHGVYIGGMTVMFFFVAQNLYAFGIQAAVFNIVTCFAKMSILLYYRQLSPQKWWRRSVYAISTVVIGYCTALFFAVLFACKPIEKAWDVTIRGGSCINVLAMFKSTAALGILTDLAMLVWAIIEIQLLVICPSLCTLRAFARHLAPRLMGDYPTTSAPVDSRYRKSFRTIGESSVPRKLNIYKEDTDDTMFHLRSFGGAPHEVQIEGQSRANRAGSPSSDDTEANNRTFDPRPGDDLERAIIQTRSVTITNTPA
ncbi:hypothetical protein DL766_002534 [Monosporascus sp. MC13-8B]|uniref:Rhodopsin domain-containing protein n=1 Tax=Monosporascus cannonballus TaxID=155416 RepID=A0ABY0GSM5_9PEZI|nr:hypothetical protein DL762_009985 [Monosporascus cannonballus]RYP01038.1 hypothetical protein DL763_000459 [Monosporascus cannonballus]RYP35358.1 hypothetical protein DL766_002534 [Monosporascus sp. MC13-8B]